MTFYTVQYISLPKYAACIAIFPFSWQYAHNKQPTILGAGKKLIFRRAISIANEITLERTV